MRRQLTDREWMLLCVLGVLLLITSYLFLFYTPMTAERDRCIAERESCEMEIEAAQVRLVEKLRMERELKELFAGDVTPLSIADYDNLKPVLFQLNTILAGTDNYSLSFNTVDTTKTIVRRGISMSFTCDSYDQAKEVIQSLHDNPYRCILNDLSISLGYSTYNSFYDYSYHSSVSVSATIVFFEYQESPQAAAQ